ncbi:MAG: TerB family tellurite resistance protein [Hyphomicrobiaceae bacterium]|nr:TerB family tellurite resistance protein [Hyphomicrobiaceae bacterium]
MKEDGRAIIDSGGRPESAAAAAEAGGLAGAARRLLARLPLTRRLARWFEPTPASKQLAFTIAFVGLAAKMAKADGVAVQVEREAFERSFHVPEGERAGVLRVFRLAAQDVAGYEVYAERIARALDSDRALLRDVFECLFNIAAADGVLHDAEERFLRTVAEKFALGERDYALARAMFVREAGNPYDVLGIEPDISDEALKAHYRQLVRDCHPDKLAADGVPAEFLVLADRKLAAINAAHDEIQRMRRPSVRSGRTSSGAT